MVSKRGNIQHVEINVSNFEVEGFLPNFLEWRATTDLDERILLEGGQRRSQDFRDLLERYKGFRIPSETIY